MPRYIKRTLEEAVQISKSYAETLRNLNLCETGGNTQVLKKYLKLWEINTNHFMTASERARIYLKQGEIPLAQILVKNSSYNRSHLKKRLYKQNLKEPICEMCGQDENWNGKKISLILDHKNGVRDDNRIENLRILCPNCNASLDTHCGKQEKNKCPSCQRPKPIKKKYCSLKCYRNFGTQRISLKTRKATRPPFKILKEEIKNLGFLATGRKYGVSDNAIRKWVKVYEKYGDETP